MIRGKCALLDTDFVSKTHLICKDEQNRLIDFIMKIPDFKFCCHEQIRTEVSRHNIGESKNWLENMISKGQIYCYSDEEIIEELSSIYGNLAVTMYASILRTSCDAYGSRYFEEKFIRLQTLNFLEITKEDFLNELQKDCDTIGVGQNLGELKSYVLLQALKIKQSEQIYVFCSDDKNARSGLVSIGGAKCISVLSSFLILNQMSDFTREDAEPYVQSYIEFCDKAGQMNFKVYDASNERRICKVPCKQVLEEIFDGKLELLSDGMLRYIKH